MVYTFAKKIAIPGKHAIWSAPTHWGESSVSLRNVMVLLHAKNQSLPPPLQQAQVPGMPPLGHKVAFAKIKPTKLLCLYCQFQQPKSTTPPGRLLPTPERLPRSFSCLPNGRNDYLSGQCEFHTRQLKHLPSTGVSEDMGGLQGAGEKAISLSIASFLDVSCLQHYVKGNLSFYS